jgi:uncharacterized protein (TIGR00251 family)
VIRVQQQDDAVTFAVKVHPRAKRERISGVLGDTLKVELTTPPVEGRANEACIRFFAHLLNVRPSSVSIASGASSRNKVIRVTDISAESVNRLLEAALP